MVVKLIFSVWKAITFTKVSNAAIVAMGAVITTTKGHCVGYLCTKLSRVAVMDHVGLEMELSVRPMETLQTASLQEQFSTIHCCKSLVGFNLDSGWASMSISSVSIWLLNGTPTWFKSHD